MNVERQSRPRRRLVPAKAKPEHSSADDGSRADSLGLPQDFPGDSEFLEPSPYIFGAAGENNIRQLMSENPMESLEKIHGGKQIEIGPPFLEVWPLVEALGLSVSC